MSESLNLDKVDQALWDYIQKVSGDDLRSRGHDEETIRIVLDSAEPAILPAGALPDNKICRAGKKIGLTRAGLRMWARYFADEKHKRVVAPV